MKKFLFAVAVVLVFCALNTRASSFQTEGVRVGPVAEDKTGDGADAGTPKSDSAAPKKDEKKNAPSDETKKARLVGASKETADVPNGEKKSEGEKKEAVRADDKGQSPATLSTAAATVKTVGADKPSSTSDAPTKPGSTTSVPVNTPAKSAPAEPVAADKKKTNSPAASPHTTGAATDPTVPNTNPSGASTNPTVPNATAPVVPLTSVYRIGAGDILDIRLLNAADPRQSTLYTVLAGGVLDYPLLKDPLTIAGMTTDELAAQLIAELRHRGVYERPQVRVGVREYSSHAVLVSGLVGDPGTKILRREAIPLYVVVAEAQPKPEAGRAVIISHATGKATSVDLNDAAALNTLVQSGDVVNVTVRPPEFFYIGGEVGAPGQKDFHAGMTLTQAVLASGGATRLAGERVKVARAGADGRLVSVEYSLREIEGGVVPDPVLQAGDRIEVSRRK